MGHKGYYGQYSGNSKFSKDHAHTRVTSGNYKATERDDAAHIDYLKRDIKYDDKHGHSDEKMTADEKHISKLAGDMKYDKEHHGSPAKNIKNDKIDPALVTEAVEDFKVRPPKTQGDSISLTHTMRKVGSSPQSETDSRFRFYEKAGPKGGLKSMQERIAEKKLQRSAPTQMHCTGKRKK